MIMGNVQVYVSTDSSGVKKGITEWNHNWTRNGWRNITLQKNLDECVQRHAILNASSCYCAHKQYASYERNAQPLS
jgi:ribonuclease HI